MKQFSVFNRLLVASVVTPIIMTAPIKAKSRGLKSVKAPGAGAYRDGKSTKALESSKSGKAIGESAQKSKGGRPMQSHDVTADQDQDNFPFSQSWNQPKSISKSFKYSGKASKSDKGVNQSAQHFIETSIPVSVEISGDNMSGHPTLAPSSLPMIQSSALPTALSTEASTMAPTVAATVMSTVDSTAASTERTFINYEQINDTRTALCRQVV